jgi:hypothetical protein
MIDATFLLVPVLTLVAAALMLGLFYKRAEKVEMRRSRLAALDRVKPAGSRRRPEI